MTTQAQTPGTPQVQQAADPFTQAANTQAASGVANVNAQTTANRANQTNGTGGISNWTQDPTTGQWTNNVSLDPTQQSALQSQQAVQAQRSNAAGGTDISGINNSLDTSGFNGMYSFGTPGQTNQQAQDAVMGQVTPIIQQNDAALDQTLANQGITPGSEAYNNAHLAQGRTDNNLQLQAVQAGFAQGNTDAANNINYGNYESGQNASNLTLQQQEAQFGVNNQNAALSGQGVTTPTFGSYGQAGVAAATPTLAATQSGYNALLDSMNANADASASTNNGLFSLGGALLGSSAGQAGLSSAGSYLSSLFGLGG